MTEKTKLSNLLHFAGYNPRVSKALAWLIQAKRAGIVTSREIERGADLRQPEVVIALKTLTEKGWLKPTETKATPKQGRPFQQYEITFTLEEAYTKIKALLNAKVDTIMDVDSQVRAEIFKEPVAPAVPVVPAEPEKPAEPV